MQIDGLVYLGEAYNDKTVTISDLLSLMDELDYEKCVVVPAKPKNYDLRQANDYVGAAVKENKSKLIGIARVDPWQKEEAIDELERSVTKFDFKGIYVHPWEENFQINNSIMFNIMDFAQENSLPIIVEGGYPHVSHPLQIADLARRYSDVTVIMTHGGELDLSGFTRGDAHEAMHLCSNLIMGTAGVCSHERLKDTIKELGSERIIYQSQYPLMEPGLEILRIKNADISDDDKLNILGKNVLKLF